MIEMKCYPYWSGVFTAACPMGWLKRNFAILYSPDLQARISAVSPLLFTSSETPPVSTKYTKVSGSSSSLFNTLHYIESNIGKFTHLQMVAWRGFNWISNVCWKNCFGSSSDFPSGFGFGVGFMLAPCLWRNCTVATWEFVKANMIGAILLSAFTFAPCSNRSDRISSNQNENFIELNVTKILTITASNCIMQWSYNKHYITILFSIKRNILHLLLLVSVTEAPDSNSSLTTLFSPLRQTAISGVTPSLMWSDVFIQQPYLFGASIDAPCFNKYLTRNVAPLHAALSQYFKTTIEKYAYLHNWSVPHTNIKSIRSWLGTYFTVNAILTIYN